MCALCFPASAGITVHDPSCQVGTRFCIPASVLIDHGSTVQAGSPKVPKRAKWVRGTGKVYHSQDMLDGGEMDDGCHDQRLEQIEGDTVDFSDVSACKRCPRKYPACLVSPRCQPIGHRANCRGYSCRTTIHSEKVGARLTSRPRERTGGLTWRCRCCDPSRPASFLVVFSFV